MLRAALSVVVWYVFAGFAAAAPQGDPCRTKANQLELTQCADRERAKSEAALSQAYKSLLADLDDEHRPLLEKAQSAWLAFRDADCELDASHALGGSMFPMLVADCRSGMADTRVKDIKTLRKNLADFLR